MKSVEISARTVEEAIEEALGTLNLTRDQVDIEVLDEGAKGLFGLLGGKSARVLVTEKVPQQLRDQDKVQVAIDFLQGLLDRIGAKAEVVRRESDDGTVTLEITGSNLGLVIGRRGQMLDSIQYLVNVVANKGAGEWMRFVLDAEGYRQRRADALRNLAIRMAERAREQGKRQVLEPMNAAERRIVHMALADDKTVTTHSEGEEPFRRIVVSPAE